MYGSTSRRSRPIQQPGVIRSGLGGTGWECQSRREGGGFQPVDGVPWSAAADRAYRSAVRRHRRAAEWKRALAGASGNARRVAPDQPLGRSGVGRLSADPAGATAQLLPGRVADRNPVRGDSHAATGDHRSGPFRHRLRRWLRLLMVLVIFVRSLFGMVLRGAGNSLLVVGLTHAMFNRSNNNDGIAADLLPSSDSRQ